MKENRGSTVVPTLLSILILIVIAGAAYYIVQGIRQTTQQTLAPFQQANSGLQTQVSELLHPTPTIIPDPVTYINEVRALARLETIQYSVEQVVEVDDKQGTFGFLFGQKMLVQVHGAVIAGIDMGKMQPNSMHLDNGVLVVDLPAPEVFVVTLDEGKSKIWNVEKGLFAQPDPGLVLPALEGAKEKILSAAMDDGILDVAEQNAIAYLTKFFAALGYPNAILKTAPTD